MTELLYLVLAVFFLALNAFFVLSEFAIVKVRATRLDELDAKGVKTAKVAKNAVKHLDEYLSTCQLGITIASLGLGWVGEPAFANLIKPLIEILGIPMSKALSHSISVGVAFTLITGLHVVVGELAPKNLAIKIPERSSLFVAIPLKIFHNIMFVPMWILNESANLILKALRIKSSESDYSHSEDEIRIILGQSEELGKISLGRLMMFEHLFDFGKTSVKEVMTAASNIVSLKSEGDYKSVFKIFKERKFSRYPVLKDGSERPCGFIHIKDIVFNSLNCQASEKIDLMPFVREIKFISETTILEKALRFFQENRIQLSLVTNSKDEITGLLTIEDIIEELTGEIRDEFEVPPNFTLHQILSLEASVMDLSDNTRFGAIQEMVNKLFEAKHIPHKEELAKKIIEREKSFSTAIGHQFAFPHARVEYLRKPIIAVGKSSQGILFPSPDNAPVKVIFMILTPFNDPTIQLKILSNLSKLISNVTLRKKLLNAKSIDAIHNILVAFDNKIPN